MGSEEDTHVDANQRTERLIQAATRAGGKTYGFDNDHDPNLPIGYFFQRSPEGLVLFVLFYTQACRWSRCKFCTLPSTSSLRHVGYKAIMAQIDHVFAQPDVAGKLGEIHKVILSNQGSMLDELTFSSTALMYLVARCNLLLPNLEVLTFETRVDYVDDAELEFLARAIAEGDTPTVLEIAVGFEAFSERVRNRDLLKGLTLAKFEQLVQRSTAKGFRVKGYFLQKPVADMDDDEAVRDVQAAIEYLADLQRTVPGARLNLHLNPTYAARGTTLEQELRRGTWTPPRLVDTARAVLHGKGRGLPIFVGLSDEGLAVEGGSFIRPGDEPLVAALEAFNRAQDYDALEEALRRALLVSISPG